MSEIFAEQLTAAANVVLAVFAVVTAVLAGLAFLKQSREVRSQGEMLDLQRRQLAEQEKTTTAQAEVLALQAEELRESLEQRNRDAEERHRSQAAQVTAWFAELKLPPGDLALVSPWGAMVRNASPLPVYDVRAFFHYIEEPVRGLGWETVSRGSSQQIVRIVPPEAERHLRIPDDVASEIDMCNDEVYAVSITFTDAAGNRWERDPRGALKPLS